MPSLIVVALVALGAAWLLSQDADRRRGEDQDEDLLRYMRERDEDPDATERHPWSFKPMKKGGKK